MDFSRSPEGPHVINNMSLATIRCQERLLHSVLGRPQAEGSLPAPRRALSLPRADSTIIRNFLVLSLDQWTK